ncbi:MAG: DUF480 domain-containing protein [Deltaproteobacteria bacterium]|nr:DUF480 domain-containing protein [Deltaproteobacteria bacterium]
MEIMLTDQEIRVLGCLMEKEISTPEYYPLSLNALVNACNQKTNRDPVTDFSEETVIAALNGLRKKKLAMESSGSRVVKFAETFSSEYKFDSREDAIMCILMLRGPQTLGEIRIRTERLYSFTSLDEVQEAITGLEIKGFVKRLKKQPGRKEARFMHLLGEESAETAGNEDIDTDILAAEPADNERIKELKDEIDMLREELNNIRKEFEAFRAQFG